MKKGQKRGQIAILLVVAIVIVATVVFIFFLNASSKQTAIDVSKIDPVFRPVYRGMTDCIREGAEDGLILSGLGGGKITPTENYENTSLGAVSYGLRNGNNILYSEGEIEKDIGEYIDQTIPFCLNSADYPNLIISQDIPKTDVKIMEEEVIVNTRLKLSITNENKTTLFENNYPVEINVRLGHILEVASGIINKQKKVGDKIPLFEVIGQDLDVVFDYLDPDTIVYIIHDEKSEIDGLDYNFVFLADLEVSE